MNETQWYCAKCDVEMVKKKIPTIFMKKIGFEQAYVCPKCGAKFEQAYVCPKCGAKYLSEDVVHRSVSAKEVDAEGKLE